MMAVWYTKWEQASNRLWDPVPTYMLDFSISPGLCVHIHLSTRECGLLFPWVFSLPFYAVFPKWRLWEWHIFQAIVCDGARACIVASLPMCVTRAYPNFKHQNVTAIDGCESRFSMFRLCGFVYDSLVLLDHWMWWHRSTDRHKIPDGQYRTFTFAVYYLFATKSNYNTEQYTVQHTA